MSGNVNILVEKTLQRMEERLSLPLSNVVLHLVEGLALDTDIRHLSCAVSCYNIIIIIIQFLYSANSRMADRCAAQEIYQN